VTEVHGSGWESCHKPRTHLGDGLDQEFRKENPMVPRVSESYYHNRKPRKGKLSSRMDIPKNPHLKACREEDEERRFLRRNPTDYIFKF
jgi:hypothetical protein